MIRFVFVFFTCFFHILYYVPRMKYYAERPDKFDENDCYKLARRMIWFVKLNSFIFTRSYGYGNLPETGGYIMFPNHQGKYDVLGIMYSHRLPCSVLMDAERSKLPIANEFMNLVRGIRIDKTSLRKQKTAISEITRQVSDGRRFIIFPEGGYANNRNRLQNFHSGSFRSAVDAKCPIVPVALVDSYKPFTGLSLRPVLTKVYYLEPIFYEEYKNMSTKEISNLVKRRISAAIAFAKPSRRFKKH